MHVKPVGFDPFLLKLLICMADVWWLLGIRADSRYGLLWFVAALICWDVSSYTNLPFVPQIMALMSWCVSVLSCWWWGWVAAAPRPVLTRLGSNKSTPNPREGLDSAAWATNSMKIELVLVPCTPITLKHKFFCCSRQVHCPYCSRRGGAVRVQLFAQGPGEHLKTRMYCITSKNNITKLW